MHQSITIQWERLPRREREKLDRQQHLISSRFRVTERARRDSSFSLCTDPYTGRFDAGSANLNPQGICGGPMNSCSSDSRQSATNVSLAGNKSISNYVVMPPSDAAISSSIDRPQSGAGNAATGVACGTGVAADIGMTKCFKNRLWTSHPQAEAGSCGVEMGNGTPRCSKSGTENSLHSFVTPRGERRRRGRGRLKQGGGGSDRGLVCDVRDADIASGLARRGRLGDPALGIVGKRSTIASVNQWGCRG